MKTIDENNKTERIFKEICSGLTRKTDFEKWPDSIFFFKGDECLFEYELNSGIFWCHYRKVWMVLENKNNWNYHEIKSFIGFQVEQYFKNKVVTPTFEFFNPESSVEQYFKNKEVTPWVFRRGGSKVVEQHFKNK